MPSPWRARVSQYRDGVWLIELANVDGDDRDLTETIAVEIAIALDLRLSGSAAPTEQLLTYLQHKEILLVLDNYEHLMPDGLALILDMLQGLEGVQLLVTSREALRIRAEWSVTLLGLPYAREKTDGAAPVAAELFMARRSQQRWDALGEDDLAAVEQICRLVEGLPLAIELAATLTKERSPRALAAELTQGFDMLATPLRDVPRRHQSLRMVFEMSWRTLPPTLQQHLARLSIFRGGFTAKAAQQIATTDAAHLAALGDKSLLTYSPDLNRYALHAVIRAYAAEHCAPADLLRQEHARYYLALLDQQTTALQLGRPQDAVSALTPEMENIRRAWQTALEQRHAQALADALTSLSIYHQLRGLEREGEAIMKSTRQAAMGWGAAGLLLATRAGLEQVRFQNRLGRYRPAIQTLDGALATARQGGDPWAEGMGHVLCVASALTRSGSVWTATAQVPRQKRHSAS